MSIKLDEYIGKTRDVTLYRESGGFSIFQEALVAPGIYRCSVWETPDADRARRLFDALVARDQWRPVPARDLSKGR
ncbi:hypothetical protein HDR63_02870 [bacterium]|nr:hypothetical protein [bacterium]